MIIAQISDPHITLVQENAQKSDTAIDLEHAIQHLLRLSAQPDAVIITGDCANNGTLAEYLRFRELLRPLPMPVYVIPGNHDNRAYMLEAFGTQGAMPLEGFVQYVVDMSGVRLIALDTNVPGRGEGHLSAEQLRWLDERLSEAPERPALIFMHHPPFNIGLAPLDEIGLKNAGELEAIVVRHRQIERIVAGHVHTTMVGLFGGRVAMTCSATTKQFFPDLHQSDRLVVTLEPPACLIHNWSDKTGLVTFTSLISEHGPAVTMHDGHSWVA